MFRARRRPLALVLGAALLSAAACSDSTGPNGALTDEETRELALQMGVGFTGGFSASAASASTNAAHLNAIPEPFNWTVNNVEVDCPRGGSTRLTATLSGTIDEATESIDVDLSGTQRPNNCGFDVHGKEIRVTGSLTANAHIEVKNGLPAGTHTASLVGEFDWRASDGRRGTCTVNYSATANYTTNVATVNGNFCGSTIQFTGPLTTD
jgi:hypothetical protein